MNFLAFWTTLFAFISLFYVGARYISLYSLIVNKKMNDVPRDFDHCPKVTVMVPCFNEGEQVYNCIMSIMASDYPADRLEIVALDDCSFDNTFEWMRKAAVQYPSNVFIGRNPHNVGKSMTMVNISKLVSGDILIGTDSDMIFAPDAIRRLVSCFADPDIGAVGAQVRVQNVNDNWLTQMQALYYARIYFFYKGVENLRLTARCLSGQCVAFRREIFMPLMKRIPERNFLGVHISYGEDTFLTSHLVFGVGLDRTWKVFTDLTAVCWTGTPATWAAYMNQQMRWRRGTLVNGLRVVSDLRRNVNVGGLFTTIINIVPSICVLSILVMWIYLFWVGMVLGTLAAAILLNIAYMAISGAIYNLTIARSDPMGKLEDPFFSAIVYALWIPVSFSILTAVAMCTLDDSGWITRQNIGNLGKESI
jgi:cellulose synthase/poly-beta-1,6-N-acetylglucosamine synthase-like glycosyltransferase